MIIKEMEESKINKKNVTINKHTGKNSYNKDIKKDLRFVIYQKKYYASSVELIKNTWNFHEDFDGMKDINLIYEYYFKSCLNWNSHMEVIVNEKDEVKGLLFGSIEDDSFIKESMYKRQDKKIQKWLMKKINNGDFGNSQVALKNMKLMAENDKKGEAYAYLFDSEINLFIVSSELRGMGLGRELMDNYIEFCRKKRLQRCFLWTDRGCSYSFYEKYGFKLHSKFSETNKNEVNSGMIYYFDVFNKIMENRR